MVNCKFNKDATPLPNCFWNSYFEGKAIMDPSSIHIFSNDGR